MHKHQRQIFEDTAPSVYNDSQTSSSTTANWPEGGLQSDDEGGESDDIEQEDVDEHVQLVPAEEVELEERALHEEGYHHAHVVRALGGQAPHGQQVQHAAQCEEKVHGDVLGVADRVEAVADAVDACHEDGIYLYKYL